jgi:beta-xylosidase
LIVMFTAACSGSPTETSTIPIETQDPVNTASITAVSTNTLEATPLPTLAPDTYLNPVFPDDFPDPEVIVVGSSYYAFSTNSDGVNIQVARSEDLINWEELPDALPRLPEWAVQEFGYAWAPGIAKPAESDEYLMYFTARYAINTGGTQCIGLAASPQPEGPYQPVGEEPIVCQIQEGGSIDADFYTDEDGRQYLLWKSDANSRGGLPVIYIQPISPDGRSLEGEPSQLLTVDRRWEGQVVEGPTMYKREGKYYLFYSANAFNSPDYAVGYATSDSITGPYDKFPDPILKTNLRAGIVGPGGQDIVTGPDGDTWMLFHTWTPEGDRALGLARLEWLDDFPEIGELSRNPMDAPLP